MPRSPKDKSYSNDPLEQLAYEVAEKVYAETDGKEEDLDVDEVFGMVKAELDKRAGTYPADKMEQVFSEAKDILTTWSSMRWSLKKEKKPKPKERKPNAVKGRLKLQVLVNKRMLSSDGK